MTLAIAPTELDDLFDLDVDMVMPKLTVRPLSADPSIGCGGTSECGGTRGCGGPGPSTSASTCDSYGQTGHPCQCF